MADAKPVTAEASIVMKKSPKSKLHIILIAEKVSESELASLLSSACNGSSRTTRLQIRTLLRAVVARSSNKNWDEQPN